MKQTAWIVGVLLMLSSAVVFAQEADRGNLEITVHSGWSFLDVEREDPVCIVCDISPVPFYNTRTNVESSMLLGFKAGYYLNDRIEVEGRFAIAPGHNVTVDNSFICPPGEICPLQLDPGKPGIYYPFFYSQSNMVAYEYGGDFVYHFTAPGGVRPYGRFGIGGVSSDIDTLTHHDFAFQFGLGAKFDISRRVGFRLEVLDQVIPDYFLTQETEHDLQLHYGFIFRL